MALALHFACFLTSLQLTSVAAATALARQSLGTGVYTTLCYGMCAAVVAVVALVSREPLAGFDASGWLGILAVTVAAPLVGHTAFNHLLATMSPLLVSMIILLEIPGAALLAAAFLAETLPGGTYAGLGMILAGLAVVVLGQCGPGPVPGKAPALADLGTD